MTKQNNNDRDNNQVINDNLAQVISDLGSEQFYASLLTYLSTQVLVELPQFWLLRRNKSPRVLFHTLKSHQQAVHLDEYIQGAYENDPAYQASLQKDHDIFYHSAESAEDFAGCDTYMKDYFREMRVKDEVGFIVDVQPEASINLSLQRKIHSDAFSKKEIYYLRSIASIIKALLLQHWQLLELEQSQLEQSQQITQQHAEQEDATESLAESVDNALALFGSSLLTKRELEVLQKLLQGHSNQSAADKLGISLETLRRHRKHIYQKLDIGSQSELFSLFIHSLPYLADYPDRDPLLQYHAPAASHD